MTERERLLKVYFQIDLAYEQIANIRERHHNDGEFLIDVASLKELATVLYHWRKRLETEFYGPTE